MKRRSPCAARGRILAAALQVFGDNGYKEATVREIARVAGVALGGLYPYFGSKEQLYVEVILEEMRLYNERIGRLGDEEPRVAIRRYIENHLEYTASKKEIVSRHFKDYDLPFVRPVATRFFEQQKAFLEAIIGRGAEGGLFSVADRGEAALFVLCLLKGALFYDLSGMIDLKGLGEALCRLVFGILRGQGLPGAPMKEST